MDYVSAPRVLCLYRVSTKHQVENNDIPMQRKECRSFCQRKGWRLYREIDEMGVSGYSLSLNERDAIQTIKDAALHREFDIFLVYMFDRIGRKEFEVPAFLRLDVYKRQSYTSIKAVCERRSANISLSVAQS